MLARFDYRWIEGMEILIQSLKVFIFGELDVKPSSSS
jgi:hypothetical protein